ncbi:MAG: T9SS type A sorting domain-containing protein [Bacteroidales bacterium]|nr:T9SS type A sorting domain-containing protein [Bacteroidales bacterium]
MRKIYVFFVSFLFALTIFSQDAIEVVIFEDDFESGSIGWTTEVYEVDDLWHLSNLDYYSPVTALWCGIEGQGNYSNGNTINTAVISPDIDLTDVIDNCTLDFYENYNTESGYDLCAIDISIDNGLNWQSIRSGLTGSSGGWVNRTLNITDYCGNIIKLRFHFNTQDPVGNNYSGWFIDDVLITGEIYVMDTLPSLIVIDEEDWSDTNFVHEEYYSTIDPNPLEFELMNLGLETLEIATVTASGTGITLTQPAETSLEYGESTILLVSVASATTGAVSGTITINSNDAGSPLIISIQGEAIAAPRQPIPELSFEGQVIQEGNFNNPLLVVDTVFQRGTAFTNIINFNLINKGLKSLNISNLYMIGSGSTFQNFNPIISDNNIEYGDTAIITVYYYVSQNRRQIAAIALDYDAGGTMDVTEKYWITGSNEYKGTYLSINGPWSWYTDSKGNDSLVIDFGYIMVGETEQMWEWFQYMNWGEITIEIDVTTTNAAFGYESEFTPNTLTLQSGKLYQEYDLLTCTASDTGIISGLLIINHNDTTQGAIDTVYLTAYAYEPEPVSDPAEFVLYKEGEMIDTNWLDMIDFGGAMIDNDRKYVWFKLVNIGGSGAYVGFNYTSSRFLWVDEYDNDFYGNQYIGAGDSLVFAIRFDPTSASIYRNYMGVIELSDEYVYIPLMGTGLQEKALALLAGPNIYYDDQISYQVNIYSGYADTTQFSLMNLSPFAFTVDSIVIEGDTLIYSTNDALPKTIGTLESFDFTTMFDPFTPDGYHLVTIKIYSCNKKEPIYVLNLIYNASGSSYAEIMLVSEDIVLMDEYYQYDDITYVYPAGEGIFKVDELEGYYYSYVSAEDGSRDGIFRLFAANGYNVVIDTSWMGDTLIDFFTLSGIGKDTVVKAGDSIDFTITFEPRDTAGNIVQYVALSDSNSSNFGLTVVGYAVVGYQQAASLEIIANSNILANNSTIDFGMVPRGGIADVVLMMRNLGVDIITVEDIEISDDAFTYYTDDLTDTIKIDYLFDEELIVYFMPEDFQLHEGTLTINSNAPGSSAFVINLKGMGIYGTGMVGEGISQFGLYPNPAVSFVRVETGFEVESIVEIYNLAGIKLLSELITGSQVINVSELESGMYMLKIVHNGEYDIQKLIIQ